MKKIFKILIYPEKSFYRKVFAIALPIALQNVITLGVNMTDTIMVGMLGETHLAASSLANQFITVFHTLIMGISMGASVLLARYWGMKKMESLRKTITILLRITLVIAVLFSVMTFAAPEQIMRIFTSEEEIIRQGALFLDYSVFTYLFQAASVSCTIVLRNIRKVKIPMLVSIGAFVVNIFGNYAFIFGKFGMPELGIAGAAVSTLLVRIFECVTICGYLLVFDMQVQYRIRHMFMKTREILSEYIRVSIPVMFSDLFLALANSVVMMIIGRMGGAFVAANAVTAVVVNLANILIQGIGQSSAIITGNTLGEGKREEVQKQGYAFFGLGIVIGLVCSVGILLISGRMISIYHLSDHTAEITKQLMYAIALINVFQSANSILTKGTLRGGGDTKVLMAADSIFLWIAAIPLGSITGLVFHTSAFWVYTCLKCDHILKCIWAFLRLRSGKWIKNINAAE